MELQQLRYFLAVAETGGFGRAARRCHVAQPSLSQQVQKLEKELGVPLFDRLPRGAVLTEAGQRLRGYAERILGEVADAARHVGEVPGTMGGRLAIGAIPTVAPFVLPAVVQRFAKAYPGVELRIEENLTEALVEAVAVGELDLALVALPIERDGLHPEPLATEPLLVALPAEHRLASRKTLRWADLAGERLIVLHEMHCLGRQIGDLCRRFQDGGGFAFVAGQLATIQHLVGRGIGLSLLPAMAARADRSVQRVYLPLSDESPTRTLAALTNLNRYRTNAARAMVAEWRAALVAGGAEGRPPGTVASRTRSLAGRG